MSVPKQQTQYKHMTTNTTHMSQQEVENTLSKGIWKVTFTKRSDGTLCTMICTRDFKWLSQEGIKDEMDWTAPKGGHTLNPHVKVWCIERQSQGEKMETVKSWRSFDVNNIVSLEFFSSTDDSDFDEEEVEVEIL